MRSNFLIGFKGTMLHTLTNLPLHPQRGTTRKLRLDRTNQFTTIWTSIDDDDLGLGEEFSSKGYTWRGRGGGECKVIFFIGGYFRGFVGHAGTYESTWWHEVASLFGGADEVGWLDMFWEVWISDEAIVGMFPSFGIDSIYVQGTLVVELVV